MLGLDARAKNRRQNVDAVSDPVIRLKYRTQTVNGYVDRSRPLVGVLKRSTNAERLELDVFQVSNERELTL